MPQTSETVRPLPTVHLYTEVTLCDLMQSGEWVPPGKDTPFLPALMKWIEQRHGPNAHTNLFLRGFGKSPQFRGAVVQVWEK